MSDVTDLRSSTTVVDLTGPDPAAAPRPVFIFSLPRSGSTLLQSLLASSGQVATASEPWLMLPLVYSTRTSGVFAEYRHTDAVRALSEFVSPEGGDLGHYWEAVGRLAREMYANASEPASVVFVDKTPRYHLIVDEIAEIFPEAGFVFLWRNPLAVVSSIIETWGGGRWNVHHFDVDVHQGVENLVAGADRLAGRSIEVNYEALVADPVGQVRRITSFLGLEPIDSDTLLRIEGARRLKGSLGDQVGIRRYSGVTADPVTKWTGTLDNPVRKRWARRYLRSLGDETLSRMGYSMEVLLRELDEIPNTLSGSVSDGLRMALGAGRRVLRHRILR